MGWQRRMGGAPGPLSATGEADNGEPLTAEMLLGGVWTDITAYVMVRDGSQKVSIPLRGQSGEGSTPDRSTCQFQLNNRDGRWTPRKADGEYYGLIGRNTQIRFSVPNGYGGKSYRFWGEVSEWPQHWDPTGNDIWVDAEASGPMRRYAQGRASTHSVIYDAISSGETGGAYMAYWPCEDIAGSTSIASAITGRPAMAISGTPELATYTGAGASDPLPVMTDASFTGGIPKYTGTTICQVRFLLFVPANGATDGKVICTIAQNNLDTAKWELYYGTGGTLGLRALDGDDATLAGGIASTAFGLDGRLVRVSIELQDVSLTVSCAIRVIDVESGVTTSATGTQVIVSAMSRVTSIAMCPARALGGSPAKGLTGGSIGHVTMETAITSVTDLGDRLNPAGETAGRRIARICTEHGIAFDSIGDLDTTAAMGDQSKLKPLDLIQECAAADLGILYENLAVFGLGYRTRASLYNQDAALTLTYTAGQLAQVPVPIDDDQLSKNTVAVTRTNGNTVTAELTSGPMSTAEPPAGIGDYGDPVTINVHTDDQLPDQANWRLHLGTVDEARFPQIAVNLAHPQFTADPALRTAVLALRPGDRLAITGQMPGQAPDDVSVIVLGFSESIDQFEHRLTFNCAPESPYRVMVLDSAASRLHTSRSILAADITSGATSADVTTTSGPLWITTSSYPTQFPFDVRVGGETWTVTGITPSVSDTFTRVTVDSWGTPDVGAAWTSSGSAATDYATNGSVGTHLLTTVASSRRNFIAQVTDDWDIQADMATDQLAAGDSIVLALMARYTNLNNMYMARLELTTTQTVVLSLRKRIGIGTETELATFTTELTHATGTYIRVRFKGVGSKLYAKAWLATAPEVDAWQVTATDGAISRADSIGVRSLLANANTNVNPTASYDNFYSLNPQTFTITRSVNGVTKAHNTGAPVAVADTHVIAL